VHLAYPQGTVGFVNRGWESGYNFIVRLFFTLSDCNPDVRWANWFALEQDPTIIANGFCDNDIRFFLLKKSPAEQEHKCVKTKPYKASSFHIERRKTEREREGIVVLADGIRPERGAIRQMENISRGSTFGDFVTIRHRGVDAGRRNCKTSEYKSTDYLSPLF
jgi:hypothetical protein